MQQPGSATKCNRVRQLRISGRSSLLTQRITLAATEHPYLYLLGRSLPTENMAAPFSFLVSEHVTYSPCLHFGGHFIKLTFFFFTDSFLNLISCQLGKNTHAVGHITHMQSARLALLCL